MQKYEIKLKTQRDMIVKVFASYSASFSNLFKCLWRLAGNQLSLVASKRSLYNSP